MNEFKAGDQIRPIGGGSHRDAIRVIEYASSTTIVYTAAYTDGQRMEFSSNRAVFERDMELVPEQGPVFEVGKEYRPKSLYSTQAVFTVLFSNDDAAFVRRSNGTYFNLRQAVRSDYEEVTS